VQSTPSRRKRARIFSRAPRPGGISRGFQLNGSNRLRSKEDSLPLPATTLHSSTERTEAASLNLRDERTSSHASPFRGSKALAPTSASTCRDFNRSGLAPRSASPREGCEMRVAAADYGDSFLQCRKK
jgi:hypothetical protein